MSLSPVTRLSDIQTGGARPRGNGKNGGSIGRGRGGGAKANVTRVTAENGESNGETHIGTNRQGFPTLSNDQWNALLDMLNQNKGGIDRLSGKTFSVDWIIDSGASHHMTGNLSLLTDVCELTPLPVGLPDGSNAVAEKEEKLYLGNGVCL